MERLGADDLTLRRVSDHSSQHAAELIGINDTWLRWRGSTNVSDFNNLTTPGIYQVEKNEDTLNAPSSFGIMEVLCGSNSTIIQRVNSTNNDIEMRTRSVTSKTWTEWEKL